MVQIKEQYQDSGHQYIVPINIIQWVQKGFRTPEVFHSCYITAIC